MSNIVITDKRLLSEIKRIGSLISPEYNSNKYIITEQLTGIVDELIQRYADNVGGLFGFTSKKNYESIVTSLKKVYDSTDKVVKKLASDDTVDTLKAVFPKMSDNAKKMMVELIIKYSNESMDNVLTDIVTAKLAITNDELTRLAKAYPNDEKGFLNNVFPADTPEYLKLFISRFWKKVNGVGDILSPEDISKLSEYVGKKGGTTFISDLGRALSKSLDEITIQVNKLNDEYISKIESGAFGVDRINEMTNAYSVAISRQLNMAEMKMKQGAEKVIEMSDMSDDLKRKILDGSEDIFVIFRKARSAKKGKLLDKLYEMLSSVTYKLSDTKLLGFRYPTLKIAPEFKQYFLTGQWAFLSDVYYKAIQKNAFSSKKQMLAYLGALAKKSVWGAAFAAVSMAALATLWVEVRWKEGVNYIREYCNLTPLYPNPQEGRSECESVLTALGDTYLRFLCKFINNGTLLIPVVGTVEVSPIGLILKALTGKDKILFGVGDVDKEIEQNLEEESGNVPLPPLPDDNTPPPPPPQPDDNNTPNDDGRI